MVVFFSSDIRCLAIAANVSVKVFVRNSFILKFIADLHLNHLDFVENYLDTFSFMQVLDCPKISLRF